MPGKKAPMIKLEDIGPILHDCNEQDLALPFIYPSYGRININLANILIDVVWRGKKGPGNC
jgi:hypothetical protein